MQERRLFAENMGVAIAEKPGIRELKDFRDKIFRDQKIETPQKPISKKAFSESHILKGMSRKTYTYAKMPPMIKAGSAMDLAGIQICLPAQIQLLSSIPVKSHGSMSVLECVKATKELPYLEPPSTIANSNNSLETTKLNSVSSASTLAGCIAF
jgi:hypothetical protein